MAASPVFADMFLLPTMGDVEKVEGSTESNPIVLPAQYAAADFTSLLKVMYPRCVLMLTQR